MQVGTNSNYIPLQRRLEYYIIMYFWKITRDLVLNIDGTMEHKINTRKHHRHGIQCIIEFPQNRNRAQSLQENSITAFRPRLYNSLPKYRRDIESIKSLKFKIELGKFIELIPDEPKWSTMSPRQEATASLTSYLIGALKKSTISVETVESPIRPLSRLNQCKLTNIRYTQREFKSKFSTLLKAYDGYIHWKQ